MKTGPERDPSIQIERQDARDGQGWSLMRNRQPLNTPGGERLWLPTAELARAIAEELESLRQQNPAAEEKAPRKEPSTHPPAMPLTRLAYQCIDQSIPERATQNAALLAYLETDLLCYPATGSETLVAQQEQYWTPLRDWFEDYYGVELIVTVALMPVAQQPATLTSAHRVIAASDPWQVTGQLALAQACGSYILASAATLGRVDAEQLTACAFLHEEQQLRDWGEDPQRRAELAVRSASIQDSLAWLRLLKS